MKSIKIPCLVLLLILLNLFNLETSLAQSNQSILKGKIVTADGKAAGYVNVGIRDLNKGTVSDENGTYILRNVPVGQIVIKVSFIGLQTQEKAIKILDGQITELNFELTESSQRLSEVIITAARNNQQVPAIGKAGINPMDLPQSTGIVSSQVISDQQASRLSDVMKNVSGVAMGSSRGSTSENFFARGYSLGSNNYFKNGSRYNSGSIPEVSTLEQVEVLKGSAAMLYGNVSGGAIVNLVTKRPKFEYGGEVSLRGGSFNSYKPIGDIYGPISKNLAFRMIGTFENNESYRNNVKSDKYYINPSLLYKAGKKTDILVQGDYLKYELTPDFGIGSLAGKIPTTISRSSYFNTPWAYNKAEQTNASATIDHKFNDSWKLNVIGSYQLFERDYYSTERIQADAVGDWSRSLTRSNTAEDYYSAQANLTGKIKTGKISHQVLIGTDADSYMNTSHTFNLTAAYDKINLLDPNKYNARVDMPFAKDSLRTEAPTYRLGYYAQDLVSLSDKFKVLAGLRWSYQKALVTDIYNLVNGTTKKGTASAKADQAFSPKLGLVYQPITSMAVFASYSNNFTVNSGIDVFDQALRPSLVDQFELGLKNDFLNGKLTANFALYKIINNNLAQQAQYLLDGVTVNTNTNIKELTGQTTSDGFELDLTGSVVPGLYFMTGYSFNYMRYTKTSGLKGSYIEGEHLVSNPAHTAHGSLFYTFNSTKLKGVKLGASTYYIGERNAGWNNTVGQTQSETRLIPMSGFTTFDLSAGYTLKRISLLAKLSNITNELNYYVHENYSVNPIPPRQFLTTLSYKF
ncbi:iron complex outermembrane recepter protein [Daejeonella rubra]|uniref:Iron complex outermembrane recepter protein n=1 Tax=Daejeonella rubra TaxID=990371 RepID=A0A1G9RT25_9SPHI|nr:TonB-dependent receptor [Daejeonella rubra]SDM26117.1 iron complex outermembrane recepter protein [Daejeonella rubra]